MKVGDLHAIIAAACPIDGISSSGEIWFDPTATVPQRAAAQVLMDAHLPTLDTSFP